MTQIFFVILAGVIIFLVVRAVSVYSTVAGWKKELQVPGLPEGLSFSTKSLELYALTQQEFVTRKLAYLSVVGFVQWYFFLHSRTRLELFRTQFVVPVLSAKIAMRNIVEEAQTHQSEAPKLLAEIAQLVVRYNGLLKSIPSFEHLVAPVAESTLEELARLREVFTGTPTADDCSVAYRFCSMSMQPLTDSILFIEKIIRCFDEVVVDAYGINARLSALSCGHDSASENLVALKAICPDPVWERFDNCLQNFLDHTGVLPKNLSSAIALSSIDPIAAHAQYGDVAKAVAVFEQCFEELASVLNSQWRAKDGFTNLLESAWRKRENLRSALSKEGVRGRFPLGRVYLSEVTDVLESVDRIKGVGKNDWVECKRKLDWVVSKSLGIMHSANGHAYMHQYESF